MLAICNTFKVYFSNKRKKKAQIESGMEKSETKATHDTEQRETTIKKNTEN